MTAIIPIDFNGRLFFRLDVLVWARFEDDDTYALSSSLHSIVYTQLRPLSR